jgi:hypothetical protein
MHAADAGFDFLPWEVEQDPMIAAAVAARPTPPEALRREIETMRHYLRKMHGRERRAVRLG